MNFTFIFVCQRGLLEAQSLLLAMSLRKHLSAEYELVAAIPEQFGKLHPITYGLLDALKVRRVQIRNTFNPIYPVGNKLFAVNIAAASDYRVFLDSDLLCVKEFDCRLLQRHDGFFFKTGRYDVISHKEWTNIHKLFNKTISTDFKHIRSPFVVFKSGMNFEKQWLFNAQKIYKAVHKGKFTLRRVRQIDQISLAITIQQFHNLKIYPRNNPLFASPSEVYRFEEGELQTKDFPIFLVLQKGWLHYEHQGHPKVKSSNPNSLAYYDEIRSLIYQLVSQYPKIDRIPSWKILHDLYLSQTKLPDATMQNYLRGVEGDQK
jgi:hypothetical protein